MNYRTGFYLKAISFALLLLGSSCHKDINDVKVECRESISDSLNLTGHILILDGDSRTVGWNCSEHYPYGDVLLLDSTFTMYNLGDGGLSSTDVLTRAACGVDQYFNEQSNFNVVVLWIGVNDILVHKKSAIKIYRNIRDYGHSRRAKGWKVVVCTEVSIKSTGLIGNYEPLRLKLNTMITENWMDFADALADLGGEPDIGAMRAFESSEFFCDSVHLSNRGYQVVAAEIRRAINSLR